MVAILRLHLTGEMNHEHATPAELGLAAQQYLANGSTFNAAFFAGFVRRAKRGIERGQNRARNDSEDRFVADEQRRRDEAADEERQSLARLHRYAEEHPARFAELQRIAEAGVPKKLTLGRELMVRAQLLKLIRDEDAAA